MARGVVEGEHGWDRNSLAADDNFREHHACQADPMEILSRAGDIYEE
jgi:hypothetical protein